MSTSCPCPQKLAGGRSILTLSISFQVGVSHNFVWRKTYRSETRIEFSNPNLGTQKWGIFPVVGMPEEASFDEAYRKRFAIEDTLPVWTARKRQMACSASLRFYYILHRRLSPPFANMRSLKVTAQRRNTYREGMGHPYTLGTVKLEAM